MTMNRRFDAFIANRLSTTSAGKRSATAATVATIGITLSIFTILITLSIVNGFQKELKSKLAGFNSTFTISKENGEAFLPDETAKISESVIGVFPDAIIYNSITTPALVKSESNFDNLALQWHTDPRKQQYFRDYVIDGGFITDSVANGIVISGATARQLDISIGDRLDIVIPAGNGLKQRRLTVNGIYDTHFTDFDRAIAFVSPEILENLYINGAQASKSLSIDVPGLPLDEVTMAEGELRRALNTAIMRGNLNARYYLTNIAQEAGGYLGWLALLDTNVIVITILMIFIAVFTLICSIIIIILERVPMIGLLKSMGASNGTIKRIFIIFGSRILILSVIIADVIAVLLIIVQNYTGFLKLDPEDYYLTQVPMEFNVTGFVIVDLCAIALGLIFMLLPAMTVNRISLSQAIKFE